MRVALGTIEVDDAWRRALACHHGRHNALATRDEVRDHYLLHGGSSDDDVMYEHDQCDICRESEDDPA